MKAPLPLSKVQRVRSLKVGLGLTVAAIQFGLLMALGLVPSVAQIELAQTPVDVVLVRPEPVVPPVRAVQSVSSSGGGAPAAPSRVRQPPINTEREVELVAPVVPAPVQPLTLGLATEADPAPAKGMGDMGEGRGEGAGDGEGPGRGGSPPIILRGASRTEVLSVVPPAARRARQAGRASINCIIRLDETLGDCRVVSETPSGFGFGEAGLQATRFFRYRPPTTASGRPVEGQRVTISVMFGRQ